MSMKIFSDEFTAAILETAGNKRVSCSDLAETHFKDWLSQFDKAERNTRLQQLSGCVNLLANHDLPDTHNVEKGRGAGFGVIDAERNTGNGMKSEISMTPEIEDMIQKVFAQWGIQRSGISLGFVAGKLTNSPALAKKFENLVGAYLQAGKVKGFHLEGRTVKTGSTVIEEVSEDATGTDG